MEQTPNTEHEDSNPTGFWVYAQTRIIAGIIAIVAILWLLNSLIGMVDGADSDHADRQKGEPVTASTADLHGADQTTIPKPEKASDTSIHSAGDKTDGLPKDAPVKHSPENQESSLLDQLGLTSEATKGVTFTLSVVAPMKHELHERWWGWRPNDIINFTDNVNSFQLGVLEITRRTTVILTDRISRTSSADALDKHLENAMNAFMISADRYWFPSAESKYKEGLEELRAYADELTRGEARFYNRIDNLIPLLRSFEDLLGSCDENLVKTHEVDGSKVSHFMADDYFYYAKGVASALHTILQAVLVDYQEVLEVRRATEDMHQAIESLHHAMQIDPIYVTNADLSGILANHRANIASTISHAQSYLQVVITAFST